jgi:hypothetical protein
VTAASNIRTAWDRISRLDLVALLLVVAGGLAYLFEINGSIFNYLKFIGLLAALYLLYRLLVWGRNRLLWSLRNRLIIAGLFLAFVPVLLLMILAVRSAEILYSQLASYLLYEDVQRRKDMLADIAEHIAAAHAALPRGVSEAESERILAAQSHAVHDRELPGLNIEFSSDPTLLRIAPNGKFFAGLMQQDKPPLLSIISLRVLQEAHGIRIVTLRVPITDYFLETVAPDLGAIQLNVMKRYKGGPHKGVLYTTNNVQYEITDPIVARNRSLQPAMLWIDSPVNVVSRLDSTYV